MYRELTSTNQADYNHLVDHPLQSWEWGEFRNHTRVKVTRVGFFEQLESGEKLVAGFQLTFHSIPLTHYTVGYFPKGKMPTTEMIAALKEIGNKYNAIFIKLEPNVVRNSQFPPKADPPLADAVRSFPDLTPSPKPLFTKYTFYIDLTKSESELLKSFESKTRYNIRLAQKHGVTIQEENTPEAFNRYLQLTQETTKRQGFYAHDDTYHQKMWSVLHRCGIAHLLTARYQSKIVVAWILFLFNNKLYYPYGASSTEYKNVMASNLIMWEAIRWGKAHGAMLFDLWGTSGPNRLMTIMDSTSSNWDTIQNL